MKSLFIVAFFFVFNITAFAQSAYQGSVSGNIIVYSIQSLNITQTGGNITFSNVNDYFNGVTQNNYFNIKVKSNENWLLNYQSQSTYFSPLNNGASTDMPCTVLGIRKSDSKSFKQLTTSSKKLTQGNRGGSGDSHDFNVDVNLNPGFGYSGGLYSISILFTLTRQ